jgi:predicted glycoside hydrolase/deacetylase ChbG (UPF0249 family)
MNVIVNADDFGAASELNLCVQKLYKKGIVLSTTLIANSPSFDQAVSIAKESPGLGVGVHLCLDGPFNMNMGPSSLINPINGHFFDHITASKKLQRFEFSSDDIYNEYDKQIRKILDHGITITHIDHHHHFHLHLQSLSQIFKLSRKYNIKSIRSQKILSATTSNPANAAYRFFHQTVIKSRFIVPDGYTVLFPRDENPFESNLERLRCILGLNYKNLEIECHPVTDDTFDTQFLSSPAVVELLKNHNIINYGQLKLQS